MKQEKEEALSLIKLAFEELDGIKANSSLEDVAATIDFAIDELVSARKALGVNEARLSDWDYYGVYSSLDRQEDFYRERYEQTGQKVYLSHLRDNEERKLRYMRLLCDKDSGLSEGMPDRCKEIIMY